MEILKKGVGHSSGSYFPGEGGSIVYMGHNSKKVFRNFSKIEKGDLIIYSYNGEITKYSVDEIGIIKDTDWSKLQNSKQDKLTLITCLEDKPEYRRYVQAIKI